MHSCDLVIVGSGPVAGTVAALLAQHPWQITRVGVSPPASGSRAIALNHSSRQLFDSLGWWEPIARQAGQIRQIEVSRQHEPGKTHLQGTDIDAAELGWVIPEEQLLTIINEKLGGLPNLQSISATPAALTPGETSITLGLDRGSPVTSRLIIGADGAASNLRHLAALPVSRHDFQSIAICAAITSSQPHDYRAWERFTDSGPIALLPLPGADHYSLVWCVDAQDAEPLLSCDESEFIRQLQQAFGHRAGRFTGAVERSAYPLSQQVCRIPVADRLALVGSAARHIHPVGGQGLNLALRDLSVLVGLINQAGRQQGDPGSSALLQRYCDLRRGDWRATEQFARHLPGLFARRQLPLSLGRNLALTALEIIPPLRRAFVRRAAGQLGFHPFDHH
ncbi:MAG: FAD-dependent monooxygenase [Gammaproteobacteria bacterium]